MTIVKLDIKIHGKQISFNMMLPVKRLPLIQFSNNLLPTSQILIHFFPENWVFAHISKIEGTMHVINKNTEEKSESNDFDVIMIKFTDSADQLSVILFDPIFKKPGKSSKKF